MVDFNPTNWQIPGSDGRPIYGNTHTPTDTPCGVLVCCHGFKGYKDYGFFPTLCDQASAAGLIAHRFNFSHSGMTNRTETFEHPELFEKDRWGRQVQDLGHVFHAIDAGTLQGQSLPRALFGHSRGGVASLLFVGNTSPVLVGLITAAAPDYACNLDDLVKDQLRLEGRLLSPSGRTGQDLYVGKDWLDEIEQNPELYDPVRAAANVQCPTRIIHGSGDQTVPVDCAHNLHQAATLNSTLEIIDHASHTFNCPNPLPDDLRYDQLPYATRRMIELSVRFAADCCLNAPARDE